MNLSKLQHWLIWLPSALGLIAILYALPTMRKKQIEQSEHQHKFSINNIETAAVEKLTSEQKKQVKQYYEDTASNIAAFDSLASFWSSEKVVHGAPLLPFYYTYRHIIKNPLATAYQTVSKGRLLTLLAMETQDPTMHNMLLNWSLELFYKGRQLAPDNDSISVDIASAKLWYIPDEGSVSSNNPMAAINELKVIIKNNPRQTYAMYALGMAAVFSNQTEKAIQYFEDILKVDKHSTMAMSALENIYKNMGDKQKERFWSRQKQLSIKH